MPIFNKDREALKKTLIRRNFPKDIIVETTAYCNLKCIMCPQSTMTRPKGNMSLQTFKKIADEVAKHKRSRMWLAIMGEPLLQPERLINIVYYAKHIGVKKVCLNTNGTYLVPKVAKNLIYSGLDEFLIGIDASEEATYNKIRRGGDFVEVVGNTIALLKYTRGYITPKVIVQFIVMRENESEVEEFKRFWLSRGAIVKIRPRLGWRVKDTYELEVGDQERYPCPWLLNAASIQWNGKFNQCDGGWSGDYSPGDINKQTIEEVWNGELKERRKKHWEGDFTHPLCSECKDWMVPKSKFYYPRKSK